MRAIQSFVRDEDGVSAIEYAVLAVLVVVAVSAIGATMNGMFSTVFNTLKDKVINALG